MIVFVMLDGFWILNFKDVALEVKKLGFHRTDEMKKGKYMMLPGSSRL